MIMVAGFDKYFQIAPCFRDEDAEQIEVLVSISIRYGNAFCRARGFLRSVEPILRFIFKIWNGKIVNKHPFKRIPYAEAMEKYGTDKPDLRNPIEITDLSDLFKTNEVTFKIFKEKIKSGEVVKGIPVHNTNSKPRSF